MSGGHTLLIPTPLCAQHGYINVSMARVSEHDNALVSASPKHRVEYAPTAKASKLRLLNFREKSPGAERSAFPPGAVLHAFSAGPSLRVPTPYLALQGKSRR